MVRDLTRRQSNTTSIQTSCKSSMMRQPSDPRRQHDCANCDTQQFSQMTPHVCVSLGELTLSIDPYDHRSLL